MKKNSVAVSSSYKKQLSDSYYMSIQMRLDGLSFSVLDPVNNAIVAIGNYDFDVIDENFSHHEELILKEDIFKSNFKTVAVSVESRSFSMVPKPLFDSNRAADILRFIGCRITKDDKILYNELEMAGGVLVFSVPNFLYYFLQTQYTDVRVMHHTEPIMQAALLKRDTDKKKAIMHVVFSADGVTLIVVEQNKLKLCNKYKFKEVNDLVYIIMYALEQMGLNNNQTKIVISGDVEIGDARAELVKRFAHNVSLAQLPEYFSYEVRIPEPEHKYVNLLNLNICV